MAEINLGRVRGDDGVSPIFNSSKENGITTITVVDAEGEKSFEVKDGITASVATQSANGLMSFTDKTKLDGIATGATKVIIDSSLSSTSVNPVQNKIVKSALNNKAEKEHIHTKSEVGLENVDNTADKDKPVSDAQKQEIYYSFCQSNAYTDDKIAELINGAPETMDTLKEVADAIAEHKDVETALNEAIGKKANQTEMDAHTENDVIHTTVTEKSDWNDASSKKHSHSNKSVLDGITSTLITAWNKVADKLDKTGDASNVTNTITAAANRTNLITGEKLSVSLGKISKWFSDLKSVAFSGSYKDLSDTPTLGTAAKKDIAVSGNASTAQVVMGNDTRLTNARKASDVFAWAKSSTKPSYTKSEVGLGNVDNTSDISKPVSTAQQTAIDTAYANANKYTDKKVADLIGSAPETMDTLEEVAAAIQENKDVETALNKAIGTKANQSELDTHTDNSTIHITASERTNWNAAKTHADSTHARTDATKVEKSSTNGNIKINGTETTVYTHPSGTNPHRTTKSDVGLGNVGNFKAVSTVANQGLSNTEKSNARSNIGAVSSLHTHDEYVPKSKLCNTAPLDPELSDPNSTVGADMAMTPRSGQALCDVLYKHINDYAAEKKHDHDDRYYTEGEIDSKLEGKAESGVLVNNANLNNITTPGIYNCGGNNSITNKPSGVDAIGLIVIHNAIGSYYTQILTTSSNTNTYRRTCTNGTWSNWTVDKYTDTNTTYNNATTSSHGLMTAAMVTKLNGIASGANNYSLPTASSSTLGGVKTTSTVTSNSGYTACPIIGGIPYYKDTNTTYSSKKAASGGTDVSLVTTGEKAIWNAKTSNTGTITGIKMNGASKGTSGVVDLGTVLTGGSQTTTSNADGGSNVYTFSDKSTITVKNGSKGSSGTRGSVINFGTTITGTSATATTFSSSGLTSSLVNDMYINISTFNVYRCTTAGNASTAKWVYVGCISGDSLLSGGSIDGDLYIKSGNSVHFEHPAKEQGAPDAVISLDSNDYLNLEAYGLVLSSYYNNPIIFKGGGLYLNGSGGLSSTIQIASGNSNPAIIGASDKTTLKIIAPSSDNYGGAGLEFRNCSGGIYPVSATGIASNSFTSAPNATVLTLGSSSRRFGDIYTKSTSFHSDKKYKKGITKLNDCEFTEKYEKVFDELNFVKYQWKYNNNNTNGNTPSTRYHYGLIAQDIDDILKKNNISSIDNGILKKEFFANNATDTFITGGYDTPYKNNDSEICYSYSENTYNYKHSFDEDNPTIYETKNEILEKNLSEININNIYKVRNKINYIMIEDNSKLKSRQPSIKINGIYLEGKSGELTQLDLSKGGLSYYPVVDGVTDFNSPKSSAVYNEDEESLTINFDKWYSSYMIKVDEFDFYDYEKILLDVDFVSEYKVYLLPGENKNANPWDRDNNDDLLYEVCLDYNEVTMLSLSVLKEKNKRQEEAIRKQGEEITLLKEIVESLRKGDNNAS